MKAHGRSPPAPESWDHRPLLGVGGPLAPHFSTPDLNLLFPSQLPPIGGDPPGVMPYGLVT